MVPQEVKNDGLGASGDPRRVSGVLFQFFPYLAPMALFGPYITYCPYRPFAGPICALFEPPHATTAEPAAEAAVHSVQALPFCCFEVETNKPQMCPAWGQ